MSKSKVPYEKKVEIARAYLEGRKEYRESLKCANNRIESFCRWVHIVCRFYPLVNHPKV